MESMLSRTNLTWIQRLFFRIIRSGCVPQHVAFIMDGNRRYARKNSRTIMEAHLEGFDKLHEAFSWCQQLGIKEMTVYAFSIDNFKRVKTQVKDLFQLFETKLQFYLDERDMVMQNGICIRFLGNLDLLPPAVKRIAAQVMLMTKDNDKKFLNYALSYTARDEITNAMEQVVSGVLDGRLSTSDVTQDLLPRCFYSRDSPIPDLLIRTSGEVRLSDFLLWQTSCSCIYFCKALWPEYSAWNFLAAVFYYQRSRGTMDIVKEQEKGTDVFSAVAVANTNVSLFVQQVNDERERHLSRCVSSEV